MENSEIQGSHYKTSMGKGGNFFLKQADISYRHVKCGEGGICR